MLKRCYPTICLYTDAINHWVIFEYAETIRWIRDQRNTNIQQSVAEIDQMRANFTINHRPGNDRSSGARPSITRARTVIKWWHLWHLTSIRSAVYLIIQGNRFSLIDEIAEDRMLLWLWSTIHLSERLLDGVHAQAINLHYWFYCCLAYLQNKLWSLVIHNERV